MKTIYVTRTGLTTARFCLAVEDEADLKAQLAQRQQAAPRAQPFAAKLERDKKGALITYEMGPDWNGFKPKDWDPNV